MNWEEYQELKNRDSFETIQKLCGIIDWSRWDEKDENWKLTVDSFTIGVASFILWKIKHTDEGKKLNQSIKDQLSGEEYSAFSDLTDYLDETKQWEEFSASAKLFSDEELAAVVLSTQYYESYDPVQGGILALADKLLDIQQSDEICEYYAGGFEFSILSKNIHPESHYTAYEDSYSAVSLAEAKCEIIGSVGVDAFRSEVEEYEKFNKIFVGGTFVPNGRVKFYDFERDLLRNSLGKDWSGYPTDFSSPLCFSGVVAASLKKKGRAVMLFDAGQLSGKETEKIRKYLVDNHWINGVIALPDKLYTSTWTGVYLLVLQKNSKEIRFCDARDIYQKGRIRGKRYNQLLTNDVEIIYLDFENGTNYTKAISCEEVGTNEYTLLPQRYIGVNGYTNTVPLGSLIDKPERGITLSATELDEYVTKENTGVKCILPSSISNGVITNIMYFKKEEFANKVNYAHPGDILVNKAGSPIRCAVADDEYIVVGNTYILRTSGFYTAYYIKCFLESRKGQQELMKYSVGAKTPLISVSNLKKIEVPVFKGKKKNEAEQQAYEVTKQLQDTIYEMEKMNELFE